MIYCLSALHHCNEHTGTIVASSTDIRNLLPNIERRTLYDALKSLRDQRYTEIVGAHKPKGRTATKYALTGKGNLVIYAFSNHLKRLKPNLFLPEVQ